jgi:hypothetical protein
MNMKGVNRWLMMLFAIIAMSPMITLAAGIPDQIVPCNGLDCTVCSIATLGQRVLNMGIYLAVFLAAVLFAWAGVKFLTNRENSGEISKAKSIFLNVLIGLVGVLAAWLLIDTIMYAFMGNHLWSQLC